MSSTRNIRQVVRDVLELCELQWQLVSIDSKVARDQLVKAGVVAATAATISGSSLTVVFVSLGFLLSESVDLSPGLSLLIVAVVALLTTGILLLVARRCVSRAMESMKETRSEFAENLKWLKATVTAPEVSPRHQYRRADFPPGMVSSMDRRVDHR